MELVKVFIIPLSLAILGYLTKTIIDLILNKRDRIFKLFERQLSEFYWPIYIRLHNNNTLWLRMLHKGDEYDKVENDIATAIENNVIMKNNQEIETTIMTSIHIAFPDKELLNATKDYLKHVEIYKAIRKAEIKDKYPADFKAGYPKHFENIIEQRTLFLQERLNKLYKIKNLEIYPQS